MLPISKAKIFSLFLVLCVTASVLCCPPASAFEGGDGSASAPYQIATVADLYFAAQAPDRNYVLVNDIEWGVDAGSFQPIGTAENPFTGRFNGNGYQIIFPSSYGGMIDNVGVFGVIGQAGIVENLGVSAYLEGQTNVGALAGVNMGTVRNCFAAGSITGATNVGGLIGSSSGKIENCYARAAVSCSGKSGGGLVGLAEGGSISTSYAAEAVSGSNECGGFIGTNQGAAVTACYYSTDYGSVVGIGMGSDATVGKSAAEMRSAATFAGWDFANTWVCVEGESMPYLTMYAGRGTAENPYKIHNADEFNQLTRLGLGDAGKGKYFVQTADIEPTATMASVGSADAPFQGVFDGNGYRFINPYTMNSADGFSGLFSIVGDSAVIKNVTITNAKQSGTVAGGIAGQSMGRIENCTIESGEVRARKDAGGIVGENIYGTVINCRNYAAVLAEETGAGGIAGYNNNGRIESCHNSGTVTAWVRSAGGVAGDNSSGTIVACSTIGSVAANGEEAGGIAGRLYGGSITDSYASNTVTSPGVLGGLVGNLIETGSVGGCFFNRDIAGTGVAIGSFGTEECGLSSAQMQSSASYAGWDFASVWQMSSLFTYPTQRALYGDGTKENPYKIRTAADLADVSKTGLLSGGRRSYYRIMNSISTSISSIGTAENPFIGSIDGGGITIALNGTLFDVVGQGGYLGNIHMKSGSLANTITGATVEYCSVVGENIVNTNDGGTISNCLAVNGSSMDAHAGRFADQNLNGGKIRNCGSFCRMENAYSGGTVNIGGFVGNNNNATIENCFAVGTVTGGSNVGGFVGRNDNNAVIKNCFSSGTVYGGQYTGGFAGMNYAEIQNCYAAAGVQGESAAGFAAVNDGKISNCYFVQDGTAVTDAAATGLAAENAKKQASYSGFPFGGNPWMISDGVSMPYLSPASGGRHITVEDSTSSTDLPSTPETLPDVVGHWAEQTIRDLAGRGIINGYEDGTYRPEDPVTKAEFIKLVCETKRLNMPASDVPYTDVASSWARQYIETVYAMGVTDNLNTDAATFGVDQPISRAEAATLLGRIVAPGYTGTPEFTDNAQIPEWALAPIAAAVSQGLIQGNPDGTFAPANSLTRAEAATIISRLL